LIVNKDKFNELPEDLQEIVRTAAYRLNMWTLSEFEAQNNGFLQKLKSEKNVEVRRFAPEVLTALRGYAQEVISEITSKDPLSKKVYDAYQAFQTDVSEWSGLTEKAFYNTIQA
jgi:TRAP-type mannitol/chloroaromatic compound transport system substrate-binding protein